MNNNKKILKRSVAAFLAALNIFNFAGGSGKAILWEENKNVIGEFECLFNVILEDIDIKNFYECSNDFFKNSNNSWKCYRFTSNNGRCDSCYFLKINDYKFDFNELDKLSKDNGTLEKICFYNIDEDVSKEIKCESYKKLCEIKKDELYEKLGEIGNVLFIEWKEFIKEYFEKKLNGTILFPEDKKKVFDFFNNISNLTSSKLDENFPEDFSGLISKIKNDEFNEILFELLKRKDIFISASKILKGLMEVLEKEKNRCEQDKENELGLDVLSKGLTYTDDNGKEYIFKLVEDNFLGDIEDFKFGSINEFIDSLLEENFISKDEIEKLEPIGLEDIYQNNEYNNKENNEKILDKTKYINKIDEYIKTLEEIIKVISIHCELEEIRTKNNELSEENKKLNEKENVLTTKLTNLTDENKKLNSSSKKWKIFAGCGWVGTLLGLGYIFKNDLRNTCSTVCKKVLELKNSILG